MKTTFAAACFAGIVAAAPPMGKLTNSPNFVNFISHNNKHYASTEELQMRAGLFAQAENEVRALNAKSAASGKRNAAKYKCNAIADMTPQEKSALFGLDEKNPNKRQKLFRNRNNNGGRRGRNRGRGGRNGNRGRGGLGSSGGIQSGGLGSARLGVVDAVTVDHFAAGRMYPVKNQGGCGSCWAFAANTALEGTIAIKNNAAPYRLSEQHLVDCTLRRNDFNKSLFGEDYGLWGCGGGWMATAWYFQYKNGIMKDEDYPYTSGNTGTETQCAHDANKVIGKVTNWGQINANDGLDGVKDKLKTHPLTIAIDAGRAAFQYYESGVITENDNCGTSINHAVVVVGYTDKGDSNDGDDDNDDNDGDDNDGDDNNDDDIDDGDGNDDDIDDDDDDDSTVSECTVFKWWHSCPGEGDLRMLQDANGLDNYWKIQNSWGTWWGDEGFALFEIAEGAGVCGMNSYIEWAESTDL